MNGNAFSEIYDTYFPKLLRFSQTYMIREEEAEQIVQDIFISLWEHKEVISSLQNINAYFITLK